MWRHNHRKFSDGSRNKYMQAIAGPEPAFDAPLFPTHSSHLCCHEQTGWGRQNWVCPRARETPGTPLFPSTHSSHLCCHEQAGWGCQNWVCPRVRETLGTPLCRGWFVACRSSLAAQRLNCPWWFGSPLFCWRHHFVDDSRWGRFRSGKFYFSVLQY